MARVLEVRRDDLRTARIVGATAAPLGDDQVRFAVERFGLTANNVTYAVLGDRLRYWMFFPSAEAGWGRVPAWGFARAVETRCAEVPEATRVFGYVPMGGEFVVTARRVDERGLRDGSAHRDELPAAYNAYRRAEPGSIDDATMVLQPLFITAVLLARSLAGASRVVLSSASSKTALGTAYLLRRAGIEVAGLTASADFVNTLEVYDEVVGYDAVEQLERRPTTFVDLAGNARVRAAVHRHLRDALEASIAVGATHVDAGGEEGTLPGPRPTFFFAPDHLRAGPRRGGARHVPRAAELERRLARARTAGRTRGGPRGMERGGRGAPAADNRALTRPLSRLSSILVERHPLGIGLASLAPRCPRAHNPRGGAPSPRHTPRRSLARGHARGRRLRRRRGERERAMGGRCLRRAEHLGHERRGGSPIAHRRRALARQGRRAGGHRGREGRNRRARRRPRRPRVSRDRGRRSGDAASWTSSGPSFSSSWTRSNRLPRPALSRSSP